MLATILEFAGRVITRIQQSDPTAQIVLNATGGKKLMALGFVEVFPSPLRFFRAP